MNRKLTLALVMGSLSLTLLNLGTSEAQAGNCADLYKVYKTRNNFNRAFATNDGQPASPVKGQVCGWGNGPSIASAKDNAVQACNRPLLLHGRAPTCRAIENHI